MAGRELASRGVAEIQGLYGPFSFPEILLQQIWLRRDFDGSRARTADGQSIKILDTGRWNRLGGPDFLDARVQIGDCVRFGDVEVHLRASDWEAHGHASDPAYDRVVLHVVLFPTQEKGTKGAREAIPILSLLPLLNHDLEEYAADEAVARLADHPLARARSELLEMDEPSLLSAVREFARIRWRQKVHYSRLRIERLGWSEACHHTALEILGYRFNRASMLAVAGAHPLEEWTVSGSDLPARVFAEFSARWIHQGSRPANHPKARLRQYGRWSQANPNWPQDLLLQGTKLPAFELERAAEVGEARRALDFPGWQQRFDDTVFFGEVGGTRRNNLICDGLLPLLAAHSDRDGFSGWWYAWAAGDVPERYVRLLRDLAVVRRPGRPICHGAVQGLLGWLVANEMRSEEICPTSLGSGA